jgi:DnaJ-class molecular chaperone
MSPDNGQLVLVVCDACGGSGYEEGDRKCLSCGGYGECWEAEENAPPERRIHAYRQTK